jgi:site-specific DNA recombinase
MGRRNGGSRAFGWDIVRNDRGKIVGEVINEAETEIIRDLVNRVLLGESLRSLCRDLNRRGVLTSMGQHLIERQKTIRAERVALPEGWQAETEEDQERWDLDSAILEKKPARWNPNVLRRLLTAPRLVGHRAYKGDVISSAAWEPIIDLATFEEVKRILLDPSRQTNGGKYNRRLLLSGGLLRCGRCGGQLYSRPRPLIRNGQQLYETDDHGEPLLHESGRMAGKPIKKTQDTYVCIGLASDPAYENPDNCRNGRLRIIAEDLDAYLARAVMHRFVTSPALRDELVSRHDAADVQRANLEELEKIKNSMQLNEDDYRVERLIDRAEYLRNRAKLETQRAEAERKINSASGQRFLVNVPRDPDDLKAAYEEGTLEWRRSFLESVVESITVAPGVKGLNKFDPGRVKIKYRA